MKHPRLLLFDADARTSATLAAFARERSWAFREPGRLSSLARLALTRTPTVVVLRVGRDLERELTALDRITASPTPPATVVLLDSDHPHLAALAWDLDADWVVPARQAHESLTDVVAGLMDARAPKAKP